MSKPILCLDFDGVIHSYSSGWEGARVINDPPVPGAIAFLREAVKHFEVHIYSSRSHQEGGMSAMQFWLGAQVATEQRESGESAGWIYKLKWPTYKPSALVSIDDRAITFTGEWPDIETLKNFKPWNKR